MYIYVLNFIDLQASQPGNFIYIVPARLLGQYILKYNNLAVTLILRFRYGILGKWFKDTIGKTPISLLSGLVGMKEPDDHGVPYSLTEEFTSVYRLHPLLPEQIDIKNIKAVASDRTGTPPTVEK